MAERPGRAAPRATLAYVQRVERLTPGMVRVVLGGPGLAGFPAGEFTDHYVKLLFPPEGVTYPEPLDMQAIRTGMPRDQWPRIRTYTVRRWDAARSELTIDVVHHGDVGIAGPWARRVQPGDRIHFAGPGGAYAPDPDVAWHLLAGDESALPAVAATLERLPAGAPADVFLEVAGPAEEQPLTSAGRLRVTWLHRGDRPVGEALVRAVTAWATPPGDGQVFVHGEAGFVKQLRRLLQIDRGIPRDRLSISGYWRTGHDEDGWQAGKREWNRQVEEDLEALRRRAPVTP
jgi:NADPH-dependent ferric siderophore reductase